MYNFRKLSELSDLLLSKTARDRSQPHYTGATFLRKLRLADQRERRLRPPDPEITRAALYLQRSELISVADRAKLTARQSEVFCARVAGDSWVEIGLRHGHTKQGALQIFKQAMRKLRRAWYSNPYEGLHQVYRAEVLRFSPSRLGRRDDAA